MLGRVKEGVLQVAALNTDHTPEVPSEADRILSNKVSMLYTSAYGKQVVRSCLWILKMLPRLLRPTMNACLAKALCAATSLVFTP